MVNRKLVQRWHADIINDIKDYNGENPLRIGTSDPILRERANGMKNLLHQLFGNKCLPDKEPSVQVKPRFKVRDKVIHNHKNREVGEVAAYFPDEKFCYSVRFDKEYHNMAEHQLEHYIEPKQKRKDNMEEVKDYPPYLDRPKKIVPTKESRDTKRWTPKKGEKFWHLNEFMNVVSSFYDEDDFDDSIIVKTVNCFQSYELCQQAAESVRECLMKFHESVAKYK